MWEGIIIYILENEKIRITACTKGGEITSIFNKINDTEYLWNGNPEYWKYHAPVLFPIIGKLVDLKYRIGNEIYELPSHGIGRISEFKLFDKTDNSITFELLYNEESLKSYPYKFSLKTQYLIEDSTVTVKYIVKNLDNKNMFFSIGSHPAFMCPIEKDEKLEDCYIEFNKKENSGNIPLTETGCLKHIKKECLNNTTELKLSKELFKDDALVFDDLKSNIMTIKSKKSSKYVSVEFSGFPNMGIWSPVKGAPFVCIEPWFGHADYEDFNGDFREKEGIIELDINDEFTCSYKVTVG